MHQAGKMFGGSSFPSTNTRTRRTLEADDLAVTSVNSRFFQAPHVSRNSSVKWFPVSTNSFSASNRIRDPRVAEILSRHR
jgi:hypothetical protein